MDNSASEIRKEGTQVTCDVSNAPTRETREPAVQYIFEQCCCICRRLAQFGERAVREGFGVAPFEERHRNIHNFARRESRLPEQRECDTVDYRSLLHRDGSVLSAVSLQVLLSKVFSGDDMPNPTLQRRSPGLYCRHGVRIT